ncbi:hypothetical protein TWF173_010255 [Orbilia oligospora]|nr:hypothetical protein TWF173_010255 [Orbilia oligospora]
MDARIPLKGLSENDKTKIRGYFMNLLKEASLDDPSGVHETVFLNGVVKKLGTKYAIPDIDKCCRDIARDLVDDGSTLYRKQRYALKHALVEAGYIYSAAPSASKAPVGPSTRATPSSGPPGGALSIAGLSGRPGASGSAAPGGQSTKPRPLSPSGSRSTAHRLPASSHRLPAPPSSHRPSAPPSSHRPSASSSSSSTKWQLSNGVVDDVTAWLNDHWDECMACWLFSGVRGGRNKDHPFCRSHTSLGREFMVWRGQLPKINSNACGLCFVRHPSGVKGCDLPDAIKPILFSVKQSDQYVRIKGFLGNTGNWEDFLCHTSSYPSIRGFSDLNATAAAYLIVANVILSKKMLTAST